MGELAARIPESGIEHADWLWRPQNSVEENAAKLLEADASDVRHARVDRAVLTRFLSLHVRPAAIKGFAKRYGMLHTYTEDYVSEQGIQRTALWQKHYAALPQVVRDADKENGVDSFEPVAYWVDFSKFAFTALHLATKLDDPTTDTASPDFLNDWHFFESFLKPKKKGGKVASAVARAVKNRRPEKRVPCQPIKIDDLRARYALLLNELQDLADVKLELRWDQLRPTLEFRVSGLVSVIASQLLMAASQREDFVLCHGCSEAFRPWHQPRPGKVNLYCTSCRERNVPQRDATKKYRRTEKYRQGGSVQRSEAAV